MSRSRLRAKGWLLASLLAAAPGLAAAGVNSWTRSQDSGTLLADPSTSGVLYAGTDAGLFKSVDSGATWSSLSIRAVPLAAGPAGTVYAAAVQSGDVWTLSIFKSTDGGAHWTTLLQEQSVTPIAYPILAVDPSLPTTVYRASNLDERRFVSGLLTRSTDGGLTWQPIGGSWLNGALILALATDPRTAGTLYASIVPSPTIPIGPFVPPPAVFKSTDFGATWTSTATNGQVSQIVVDPLVTSTVYFVAGFNGVSRSTDGGTLYAPLGGSLGSFNVTGLVVDPAHPNRLYASTNGYGVFASADAGATWTPVNSGLGNLYVGSLAIDASGSFLHAVTGEGIFDYQIVTDPSVLSLNPGRGFRVTLTATDQRTGRSGTGLAIPASDLFGYFSIPDLTGNPGNPEVFVKVLDGRGVNGRFWFFYGGLTDLEYTLTVRDERSGVTRTYEKPAGSACGGFDTGSFTP